MKRASIFLIMLLFVVAQIPVLCSAAEEGNHWVKFSAEAKYFSQEVNDFSTKKAEYAESKGGSVVFSQDEDLRNMETDVDGWLFKPQVTFLDILGVNGLELGLYGLLGNFGVNQKFDYYETGVHEGKVELDGKSGFGGGFGAFVKKENEDGWGIEVGGQMLRQKADCTPYFTDQSGVRRTFAEWDVAWGQATSANEDYETKFGDSNVYVLGSKKVEFDNNVVNFIKPYAGAEYFWQRIKTSGTVTLQGDVIDSYSHGIEFKQSGWNATTGITAGLLKYLELDFYGKWPNKQELGGMVRFVKKF